MPASRAQGNSSARPHGNNPSSMRAYSYRPVGTNIRVLWLEPGDPQSLLKGSLRHVNCSYGPSARYAALSYTWGCAARGKILQTPEGSIPITTSLHNALVRIRSPTEEMAIWADGICINQDDLAEKEYQVKYMGEVYRHAVNVLVYLGEAEDESDRGFEILDVYMKSRNPLSPVELSSMDQIPQPQPAVSPDLGSLDWEPIRAIFRRPWFRRAWVVQEFLLARSVEILCGNWRGNWTDLWFPIRNGISGPGRNDERAEAGAIHATQLFPNWRLTNEDSIERFRELRKGFELYGMLGMKRLEKARREWIMEENSWHEDRNAGEEEENRIDTIPNQGQEDDPYVELYKLLFMFRGRETTEPRDSIFAYTGLLQRFSGKEPLRIDYSAPLADVIKDYGKNFLDKLGALVLYPAGIRDRDGDGHDWPSWMTNWSAARPNCLSFGSSTAAEAGLFDASAGRPFHADFIGPSRDLRLHGIVIDTIELTGMFDSDAQYDDYNAAMGSYIQDCIRLLNIAKTENRLVDDIDILLSQDGALWRVLLANSLLDGTEPGPIYGLVWEMYLVLSVCRDQASLLLGQLDQQTLATILRHSDAFNKPLQSNMRGRVLCVTKDGKLGLVPKGTRTGDLVCVVFGADVPFVIRRADMALQGIERHWLVGECYIHGIMKGEALEKWDGEVEDIVIR